MIDWRERVKFVLQKKNMRQSDLAELLGVANPTVSVWLKGKVRLSEETAAKIQYQIAVALHVNPDFIIYGEGSVAAAAVPGRTVPLLKKTEIAHWVLSGVAAERSEWIYCPVECSTNTFCFEVQGSAMDSCGQPYTVTYPDKSLVFIDPHLPAEPGKVCLFQDKTAILGIFEEQNDQLLLLFNNPRIIAIPVVKDNYIGRSLGCFIPQK